MPEAKPQQEKSDPHTKNTYRPFNEPFRFFGVLDWRYVFFAAVPSVFGGLIAHSKLVALILLCVLAWKTYELAEEDVALPLVWLRTIFDKTLFCAFRSREKGA
jgi:hypothetical protein